MCFSCVCYRLSLTLDAFINDLYKQSIFWFNGCLNASFIIHCSACTKQSVAIWTIGIIIWRCNICYSDKQTVWQKPRTNEIVGMAIEGSTYSNHII
jgi:hypothetical protein